MVDTIIYVSEHTEYITPNVVGCMNYRKHQVRALLYHVTQAGVEYTVCFKEIHTFLGMRILRIVSWREIDLFMDKQQGTSYVMHRKLSAEHRLYCQIHLRHCLGVCILRSHHP